MDELEGVQRFRESHMPVSETVRARARDRLMQQIGGDDPPAPESRPSLRPLFAVAISALLGVGILFISIADNQGSRAAADVLNKTGGIALDATSPWEGGRYTFTRIKQATLVTSVPDVSEAYSYRVEGIREEWIAEDGSGRVVTHQQEPTWPSDRDRARWKSSGEPLVLAESGEMIYGPGELEPSHVNLRTLPTDSSQLYELIDSRQAVGGPPGPVETFSITADLLGEPSASPQLRSALYGVLAMIPEVNLIESTDQTDRRGATVSISDETERMELAFDPDSSTLIAKRVVMLTQDPSIGAEPPYVVESREYLATGSVDGLNDRV
ncbi:MAG: CU044_5270 family protein [Actinomycetota bacterium]